MIGRDRGRGVDAAHDLGADRVDRVAEPGRPAILVLWPLPPVRMGLVEQAVEQERLAERDVDATELAPERGQHAKQATDRFLVLRPAHQLVDVALTFEQLVVAEIDRHVGDRPARVAQEAPHGHAEHPGARAQQPPRPAAPAFDEELDRVAAIHHHVDVLHEHDWIQARSAEAAADEEGAALAEEAPDDRQVEVHARGHVGHGVAALVDHVGEQQVVDVAAVAGHVDDLAGRRQAVEVFRVRDFDAVVHARQEAVEDALGDANEGVRVVRRDLERVAAGDAQPVTSRLLRVADFLAHGLAHGAGAQHMRDDRASPRKIGTERVGPHVPELRAHVLEEPARTASAVGPGRRITLDRAWLAEADERAPAVEHDREQPAEGPDQQPVFGEHQAEPGFLALRSPAPVHGDRHDVELERLVGPSGGDCPRKLRRRAAIGAPAQHACAALERDGRVRQVEPAQLQPLARTAEPAFHAGDLEREQVGGAALLQHVQERPRAPMKSLQGVLRHDGRSHEHAHDPAQHPHQGAVHGLLRSVLGGLFFSRCALVFIEALFEGFAVNFNCCIRAVTRLVLRPDQRPERGVFHLHHLFFLLGFVRAAATGCQSARRASTPAARICAHRGLPSPTIRQV